MISDGRERLGSEADAGHRGTYAKGIVGVLSVGKESGGRVGVVHILNNGLRVAI